MSDPSAPQGDPTPTVREPSAPSPFDRPATGPGSGPGTGTGRKPGPGVGKPLLIGCGFLLLLALVAVILGAVYQNKLAAWLFSAMESQLAPVIPDDLPPDVRQRYDSAFDEAIKALEAKQYDPYALAAAEQAFTSAARDLSGDDPKLSQDDVERLTAALEKVPAGASSKDQAPGEETARPESGDAAAHPDEGGQGTGEAAPAADTGPDDGAGSGSIP